jgi:two-component system phosphate regulon sensor histidine kinase PhoR
MSESTLVLFRDTTRKRRGEIVSQVVDKLFLLETLPIAKRIDRINVDSLISMNLAAVGIAVPFTFRIDGEETESALIGDTSGTPYKADLFPNDIISEKHELLLFLPDKATFVQGQMTVLLTLSLIFISVIAFSFVFSVRAIFRQQRLAGSIMDFINNMTHEFKTPISTIALAAEAIARPETFRNKKKLQQYTSVIADENVRMKRQVDTILQMAVLEEGEFELKTSAVNMHDVIRRAVQNLSLPVEEKHGTITAELRAEQPVVNGDIVHLTNIIHNVLDNANKYSPFAPSIVISTANVKEMCSITVRDNGIGIGKEYLHRVFDKYYRVPTGNTHDVKGFGLGLSYVKLIAEAHGGSVFISSETGKGTVVEIHLPVYSNPATPQKNN